MSEQQTKSFEDELNETVAQFVTDETGGEMQAPAESETPADEATTPAVEAKEEPAKDDKATEPAAKAEPEAKPTEQEQPAQQPQGDKSAALRAARRAEKALRQENERLKAQLEQAAKGIQPESNEFTPEELDSMKSDFPAQYKLYLKQQEIEQRIAAARPRVQAEPEEFTPIDFRDSQEFVDQVPDLLAWQHDPAAQEKLHRAIAYDAALEKDPDWIGKPLVERFQEAADRAKRAFAPASAPKPAAPAAPARTDPAAALANAQTSGPKGISDFGGGSPASAPSLDYRKMSNEDILASLPVMP